jgi:hypothetical protein
MTLEQIRLECLRLAVPYGISNPDTTLIVARARAFEAFVTGDAKARAKRTTKDDASPADA